MDATPDVTIFHMNDIENMTTTKISEYTLENNILAITNQYYPPANQIINFNTNKIFFQILNNELNFKIMNNSLFNIHKADGSDCIPNELSGIWYAPEPGVSYDTTVQSLGKVKLDINICSKTGTIYLINNETNEWDAWRQISITEENNNYILLYYTDSYFTLIKNTEDPNTCILKNTVNGYSKEVIATRTDNY